ncbi:MAG TPA: leucyl aminopeptidase, partial [Burkholderiaceae bacterium]|nr:leucyl aminopeptidase [Burkholderiaceae bacterium]
MQFTTKTSAPEKTRTGCAIVAVRSGKPGAAARAIDAQADGAIAAAIARGDLAAKAGSTLLVGLSGGVERALLVSLGEEAEVSEKAFGEAARAAVRALAATGAKDAVSWLGEVEVGARDARWKARVQALAAREAAYRFERMKSRREAAPRGPQSLAIGCDRAQAAGVAAELRVAEAIADGMDFAKDLGNLPGNVCTPTFLADEAKRLGKEFKLKVEVLDRKQMEALKMGALLAVAQGSEEPPKMIVVRYDGAGPKQAPIVLVGKGITFDTGGISIKPNDGMREMKTDMAGGAAVLAAVDAAARLELTVAVTAVVPAAENAVSGSSYRPADVVRHVGGRTTEVLNTDAEGRLVLADGLAYARLELGATVLVDVATLTGAMNIALGTKTAGLYATTDGLADALRTAAAHAGEPVWRMPLAEEYTDLLDSPIADANNAPGNPGGTTAALFLKPFAGDLPWAHLNVAGPARAGSD